MQENRVILTSIVDQSLKLIPFDNFIINKVVLGLLYSCVSINNAMGVSYTLFSRKNDHKGIHNLLKNRTLDKYSIEELLNFSESDFSVQRTIATATLNALSQNYLKSKFDKLKNENIIDWLGNLEEKKVAMIGNIYPIQIELRKRGATVYVLDEFQPAESDSRLITCNKLTDLIECDHIYISGSSLVFKNLPDVLEMIKSISGEKILIGPSAQLIPKVIFSLGFTGVASSVMENHDEIEQIINQGGGFNTFKRYTKKYTFKK